MAIKASEALVSVEVWIQLCVIRIFLLLFFNSMAFEFCPDKIALTVKFLRIILFVLESEIAAFSEGL